MVININDTKKLKNIKEEFNLLFPYLNIEFFSKPYSRGEGSSKVQAANENNTIAECRNKHNSGLLEITPDMTVSDLENTFMNLYGLFVQVFRKSGSVWLETTVTDNWSLEEQNKQGESVTRHLTPKPKDEIPE